MKFFKKHRRKILASTALLCGTLFVLWLIFVRRPAYDVDDLLNNHWCIVQTPGSKTYPPGKIAEAEDLVRYVLECDYSIPSSQSRAAGGGRSYNILFYDSEAAVREHRDAVLVIHIWRNGDMKIMDNRQYCTKWISVSDATNERLQILIQQLKAKYREQGKEK